MIKKIFFIDKDDELSYFELRAVNKNASIESALVTTFCFLTDEEGFEEGKYTRPFSFEVIRKTELDFDFFEGYIVGNNFLGYCPLFVFEPFQHC